MHFDENFALAQAEQFTLETAGAAQGAADKAFEAEDAQQGGRQNEVGIADTALSRSQGHLKAEPAELQAMVVKLAAGSHTSSRAAAGALLASHEAEQAILKRILVIKQQAVATARKALEAGALKLMRLDLERKKAGAIVLAVAHLQAVKLVHETDPSIEVPIGEKLTSVIDSISALQLEINRKQERGNA
jgi:hypothetical protein